MPRWLGLAPAHSRNCRAESLSQSILETSAPLSMAVEKGAKTAVVWLLFTLPLSLLEGVFSQNGPQRSRARRCCAAKRTLHGEDRSEILDKRERGGPEWTAKMAQSLTASDTTDFFTVEVLTLRGLITYYVLFFIHLESRRICLAGVTRHPNQEWMEQMARNVTMEDSGFLIHRRYLLHDHDSKYSSSFRQVIEARAEQRVVQEG